MLRLFNVKSSNNPVDNSQALSISTPIGIVSLEVVCGERMLSKNEPCVVEKNSRNSHIYIWDFNDFHIELLKIDIAPRLPEGMHVSQCIAFLWRFRVLSKKITPRFTCRILSDKINISNGEPESGEGLIAQCWELKNTRIWIGTEDEDYLLARAEDQKGLPLRLATEKLIEPELVAYLKDGIQISLPDFLKNEEGQLQFIVSWVENYEKNSIASWLAVDMSPEKILEAAGIATT